MANSIAVVNRNLPPHIVSVQLTDLHARRDGDQHRADREHRNADRAEAAGEHVVGPHAPADEADGGAGEDDELVAEQRLAAEHRQHLGDDAEAGQDRGCTPRGDRRSRTGAATAAGRRPARRRRTWAPKLRWKLSRNSATVMTGIANSSRNCTTSIIQVKIGMLHQRHARGTHVEDGDDQVDGTDERGDTGDLQTERPRSRRRGSARTARWRWAST